MANSYFSATGLLRFRPGGEITPLLEAIFGNMKLEADEEGAYIAIMPDDCGPPSSEELIDALAELAYASGIPGGRQNGYDEAPPSPTIGAELTPHQAILEYARTHCTNVDVAKVTELLELVASSNDYTCEASTLFELAQALDDGHSLISYEMKGALTCSKPRLDAFGGSAHFISRNMDAYLGVSDLLPRFREVDEHVQAGYDEAAASTLLRPVRDLLMGMSEEVRPRLANAIQKLIAEQGILPAQIKTEG